MSIILRKGRPEDFTDVATLVEAAIADSYYRDDLSPEQIASNQHIVAIARDSCLKALASETQSLFVAISEPAHGKLLGFILMSALDQNEPELDWLMLAPEAQGRGVAKALAELALAEIPAEKSIRLGVIEFNARAQAFYRKLGFVDTGELAGTHRIPRRLMRRPGCSRPQDGE